MTIKDIAQLAKVSASTVSRSLNDSHLISPATKERVREIARQYGFEFNASARGLVTQQIGTIGMILPDDFDELYIQVYHSALHSHLRRTLERSDLDLLVSFSRNRMSGADNIVKLVRRNKVDGLIIILPELPDETSEFLDKNNVPYVYAHYPPSNPSDRVSPPRVDRVYVDHERGGGLVAELCMSHGFRNILGFGSRDHEPEFDQRVSGLRKAFAAASYQVDIEIIDGTFTYEYGYQSVEEAFDQYKKADVVVAINDIMAIGIIHALMARNIRVPKDTSVIGYDNSPLAITMRPRLTTIAQPAEDVAFLTCERLISIIEDRLEERTHTPKHIVLQPNLVSGETTPAVQG